MSEDATPPLAEQVAVESAKRVAKKAAAKKAPARKPQGATVKVIMVTGSRGVKKGATRTLPAAQAETLIRQGHARKADK